MSGGRFVILGAPGAGKGTQAQRVCEQLGVAHLSTGDLLRTAVKNGTEAGRQAQAFMEAGKLVPDEVVFGVLFERLGDGDTGFMLDGFPRNAAQAAELDRRLADAGTPLDRAVEVHVPDERLLARITGRRSCKACGNVHHVDFMPPKTEGVCDACGGELQQRKDDNADVVAERLAVYHEQTAPLIEHYAGLGLHERVDGDRAVADVTSDLLAVLTNAVAEGR